MPKPQDFELRAVRKQQAPELLQGMQNSTICMESNVTTSVVVTNTHTLWTTNFILGI